MRGKAVSKPCMSCGESFLDYGPKLPRSASKADRDEESTYRTHCLECAEEKINGACPSSAKGTLMHNAGGGTRVIKSTRGLS